MERELARTQAAALADLHAHNGFMELLWEYECPSRPRKPVGFVDAPEWGPGHELGVRLQALARLVKKGLVVQIDDDVWRLTDAGHERVFFG